MMPRPPRVPPCGLFHFDGRPFSRRECEEHFAAVSERIELNRLRRRLEAGELRHLHEHLDTFRKQ